MFIFLRLSIYMFIIFCILGCNTVNIKNKVLPKTSDKKSSVVDYSMMVMDDNKKKELIRASYDNSKIRVRDKLMISVYKHPELSTSDKPALISKTMVANDGTIQLPRIGVIYVVGMSILELRKNITKKLKKYILNPDVTVAKLFTEKKKYYLVGEFSINKSIEKKSSLTLLELISEGGGFKNETADLRHAFVARNNKKLPINLYRLIQDGDLTQNIEMLNRDVVVIPKLTNQYVYVFSTIAQAMAGKVALVDNKMTLTQALAISNQSPGLEQYDNLETIYIVRTETDRIETFVVDAVKMFKGESLPFNLIGGDVVYLSKSKVGNINTVITNLFPVLQLIQATIDDINVYRNVIKPLNLY